MTETRLQRYKCDRCGMTQELNIIKPQKELVHFWMKLTYWLLRDDNEATKWVEIHFCQACTRSFVGFLEG